MLPNGPFYQDTGGNWVFVVAPDGRSAIKPQCAAGPAQSRNLWKWSTALQPGEKVIVSGYEAYQKMDRVEFDWQRTLRDRTDDQAQESGEESIAPTRSRPPPSAT